MRFTRGVRRPALVAGTLLAAGLVAGHAVRTSLGLELSTGSLQTWVTGLGWKASMFYVALLTFRQFLFLPAMVLLPVGGICFGAVLGTALGATGILFGALISFGLARGMGRGSLERVLPERHAWLARSLESTGPPIVGLATAHPTGPMAAAFWGAGLSSMATVPFAIAVTVGGSVRSLAYSFLGSTMTDDGSLRMQLALFGLAVIAFLPLAHPGVRRGLSRARTGGVAKAPPADDSGSELSTRG